MRAAGVVGLDLSLRGAAAVYLPPDWSEGWDVPRFFVGYEGGDEERKVARLDDIASGIVRFVKRQTPRVVHVYVEDYAYGLSARGGIAIAELGGAVKAAVYGETALVTRPINVTRARSFLLGKLARGKGAVAAQLAEVMPRLGLPDTWTADERDAWIVANAARSQLGMPGVTLAG